MALPAYAEFDVSAVDESAVFVENWLASNPAYVQGLIYKLLDWADGNLNGLSPRDRPALDDMADQDRSTRRMDLLLTWLRRDVGRTRMRLVRAWIEKEYTSRGASPPPRPVSPPPYAGPPARAPALDDARLTRKWFYDYFEADPTRVQRMATDLNKFQPDIALHDVKAERVPHAKRSAMTQWIFSSEENRLRALQWVDMQ